MREGEVFVGAIVNVNESANDEASAAKMFFFFCRLAEIFGMSHNLGCNWDYHIHRDFTPEMKPTGGYEIHIKIEPPRAGATSEKVGNETETESATPKAA